MFFWSDAKTLPCEPFRGLVDILLAGYPCQPFSTAGRRKGIEDPRHLYPYIERAIDIIRPRICFFENVRGHVTCGLPEVIASLEGLGYRVYWGIYSAEETGAAHKRERVFILAMENTSSFGCGSFWTEPAGFERGTIPNNASNELAYSNSDESERDGRSGGMEKSEGRDQSKEDQREWVRHAAGTSGETMANTCSEGHIQRGTGIDPTEGRIDAQHDVASCGSESMANSERQGLEGQQKQSARQECETAQRGSGQSVSRPGQPQQAWEHPRVISRKVESSVGLSAHGYHFREDVLRALGNSVYADTAELAFRDLLRKHLEESITTH